MRPSRLVNVLDPAGVQVFEKKSECDHYLHKYFDPTLPLVSTLHSWDALTDVVLSCTGSGKSTHITMTDPSIGSLAKEVKDQLIMSIDRLHRPDQHEDKAAATTALFNTMRFLFFHVGRGICVRIRDGKLKVFAPFVNPDHVNVWPDSSPTFASLALPMESSLQVMKMLAATFGEDEVNRWSDIGGVLLPGEPKECKESKDYEQEPLLSQGTHTSIGRDRRFNHIVSFACKDYDGIDPLRDKVGHSRAEHPRHPSPRRGPISVTDRRSSPSSSSSSSTPSTYERRSPPSEGRDRREYRQEHRDSHQTSTRSSSHSHSSSDQANKTHPLVAPPATAQRAREQECSHPPRHQDRVGETSASSSYFANLMQALDVVPLASPSLGETAAAMRTEALHPFSSLSHLPGSSKMTTSSERSSSLSLERASAASMRLSHPSAATTTISETASMPSSSSSFLSERSVVSLERESVPAQSSSSHSSSSTSAATTTATTSASSLFTTSDPTERASTSIASTASALLSALAALQAVVVPDTSDASESSTFLSSTSTSTTPLTGPTTTNSDRATTMPPLERPSTATTTAMPTAGKKKSKTMPLSCSLMRRGCDEAQLVALLTMLLELTRQRKIPDTDFFINTLPYPQLARDLSQLTREKYDAYLPICSFCTRSSDYSDVPIPGVSDWLMASNGKVFPRCPNPFLASTYSVDDSNEVETLPVEVWKRKKSVCIFRAKIDGVGTDAKTNQQLAAVRLAKEHTHLDEDECLLDAAIVSYCPHYRLTAAIDEATGSVITTLGKIEKETIDELTSSGSGSSDDKEDDDDNDHHMTIEQQVQQHKYILLFSSSATASDTLSYVMKLGGSVIFLVESTGVSGTDQWFTKMLKPMVDHIPVAANLSDLYDKLKWAKKNDEYCRRMVQNARRLHERYLGKESILDYLQLMTIGFNDVHPPPRCETAGRSTTTFPSQSPVLPVLPLPQMPLVPQSAKTDGLRQSTRSRSSRSSRSSSTASSDDHSGHSTHSGHGPIKDTTIAAAKRKVNTKVLEMRKEKRAKEKADMWKLQRDNYKLDRLNNQLL